MTILQRVCAITFIAFVSWSCGQRPVSSGGTFSPGGGPAPDSVQWAIAIEGSMSDMALDAEGNVYVAGTYNKGNKERGTVTQVFSGYEELLIAKYSPDGMLLWVQSSERDKDSRSFWPWMSGLSVDGVGNAYIVGEFSGQLRLGHLTLRTPDESSSLFIAKLAPDGSFLWATAAEPNGDGEHYYFNSGDVFADAEGNCYVMGIADHGLKLDSLELPSGGQFLAKLSPEGRGVWIKEFAINHFFPGPSATAVVLPEMIGDAQGNISLTDFFSTANFDTELLTAQANEDNDVVVATYDAGGDLSWTAVIADDAWPSITISPFGTIHLLVTRELKNQQFFSVITYSAEGALLAQAEIPVTFEDDTGGAVVRDIAVDLRGRIYLTGRYFGTSLWGDIPLVATPAAEKEEWHDDVFLVQANAYTGEVLQAITAGGAGEDKGKALAVDNAGSVYVMGSFAEKAHFPPGTVISQGNDSSFLWKTRFE